MFCLGCIHNCPVHAIDYKGKLKAKDACIGSFISVDKLEKAVIDELNKLSAEYLDKDELEQNVQFLSLIHI